MPNQTPGAIAPHPEPIWDAMVDNCEERGSEVEHYFEEKMNCLPGQLMVSFYGVFS